ncbi:inturned isoform X1 [Brachionus plicatilis]|uniref:Inturned isoform X1 n=1 Tax=Brachionus plicatilis TaxID=10195 RepID=A0A3M7PWY7_BRAPC|nr:inturned isoform X1 [Brachionus plicatilis]
MAMPNLIVQCTNSSRIDNFTPPVLRCIKNIGLLSVNACITVQGYTKDFIAAMIIESGGSIAKEIDRYKIVEPNNFYIQKLLYILLDLDNSGLMMEVNQTLSSRTSKIFFNLDKYVVSKKKRLKMSEKRRSLSQSPIRLKDGRSRSLSQTKNQADCTHRPVVSVSNDENESSDEIESINEKIYQTKSLSRHNSISDIGRMSFRGHNLLSIQEENKIFNDLYLINAVLYYASSDNGMNGVLFTPRHFDINSSLFQRFFYNYIQCGFKIKSLFEDVMELKFADDSCHQVMEQGVLLDMEIEDGKQPANKARKELNFWVVGRRKLQRKDSQSKWVVIGDFFVCFHDNLEDVVLELAFDLGFIQVRILNTEEEL